MVRQEDIGFGFKDGLRYRNIVSSQYIADAQIEFVSKGSLDDAQKESWYQKLSTILNPFLMKPTFDSYAFFLLGVAPISVFGARIKDLTDVTRL